MNDLMNASDDWWSTAAGSQQFAETTPTLRNMSKAHVTLPTTKEPENRMAFQVSKVRPVPLLARRQSDDSHLLPPIKQPWTWNALTPASRPGLPVKAMSDYQPHRSSQKQILASHPGKLDRHTINGDLNIEVDNQLSLFNDSPYNYEISANFAMPVPPVSEMIGHMGLECPVSLTISGFSSEEPIQDPPTPAGVAELNLSLPDEMDLVAFLEDGMKTKADPVPRSQFRQANHAAEKSQGRTTPYQNDGLNSNARLNSRKWTLGEIRREQVAGRPPEVSTAAASSWSTSEVQSHTTHPDIVGQRLVSPLSQTSPLGIQPQLNDTDHAFPVLGQFNGRICSPSTNVLSGQLSSNTATGDHNIAAVESDSEVSEGSSSGYSASVPDKAESLVLSICHAVLNRVLGKVAAQHVLHITSVAGVGASSGAVTDHTRSIRSSNQSSSSRKRKSDKSNVEGNEEHDGPRQKRRRCHDASVDEDAPRRLACPFNKYDTQLFGPESSETDYHNCVIFSCKSIAHLKQHLERSHYTPPFYCFRCYKRDLKSQAAVAAHLRQDPICDNLEPPLFTERISTDLIEALELKRKNPPGTDPVRYWHKLYDAFFPGAAEIRPVNPYYEGPLVEITESLVRFSGQVLNDLFPAVLQRLGLEEHFSEDNHLRLQDDVVQVAVQQYVEELGQRHRSQSRRLPAPRLGHRASEAIGDTSPQTRGADSSSAVILPQVAQGLPAQDTGTAVSTDPLATPEADLTGVNTQTALNGDRPSQQPSPLEHQAEAINNMQDRNGGLLQGWEFVDPTDPESDPVPDNLADFDFLGDAAFIFPPSWPVPNLDLDLGAEITAAVMAQQS
ncbi:uncharacterized protein HMPREF1541_05345 [Cyphellophora europaea CBS 101466]|uniref:C2H2-type domain-containing protein n=1 Tax=Cyphellophora europaea (strain CBS 101466) TaxID=1220924 RepID=W2RRM9_CYPE1|nr:uncharacterized protein HMPREF1541_05345 [Cyphellophora europaea CBS 101466]ETN39122.1 hypothetical protein HMPREF1541_05345 [Cyphellophora europaea CBS 101466]